ncbi:hypothetical protein [Amycolatopsis sp. cmx-11-12]|uniref:hypothetical protein n=1 Tax=Amycolatopsis sp. cmx-11-12 TaxID=2785795 RepID=UPI0039185C57
MARKKFATPRAPVEVGEFNLGIALLLWNPAVPRARWRIQQLRAALTLRAMGAVAIGAILIVAAVRLPEGNTIVLAVLAAFAFAYAIFESGEHVLSLRTRHAHRSGFPCQLERRPGEFFFEAANFREFGPAIQEKVRGIVEAVKDLHTSPAAAWLNPQLLHQTYLAAWDALHILEQSRPARAVASGLRAEPGTQGLADTMDDAIEAIDHVVDEVHAHLRGCVVLAQAWTEKLARIDQETIAEALLEGLRKLPANHVLESTRPLTENVFAYITAARDTVKAGPFPWELNYTEGKTDAQ